MRTIVFLDMHKSGSPRQAIQAAADLGYYTVVLTPRGRLLQQRRELPDVHEMHHQPLTSEASIRKTLDRLQEQGLRICAIVSFVDPYVSLAARLQESYGGKRLSIEAMHLMENKLQTRETLADMIYNPSYEVIDSGDSLQSVWRRWEGRLPALLKAPLSSGSKDVCSVTNYGDLKRYSETMRQGGGHTLLLESYVNGPQVLVELIATEGMILPIAVLEQDIQAGERFIITGYRLVPEPSEARLPGLFNAVKEIVTHFGMREGTCHLEMRLAPDGWKLIEANPRMSGGAMNSILRAGLGINLVRETIRLALGEIPDVKPRRLLHVYTQYVVLQESGKLLKVTGRNRAAHMPFIKEVYVKPRKGAWVQPPLSMGHRYAYVIAAAETEDQAECAAKQAAAEIRFHIHPQE